MLSAIFKPGGLAFIPYVMAGDPDLQTTRAILRALTQAGASAIELGVPYGDPLADGPTIAAAGTRALKNGTTLRDVLGLIKELRASAPIVLFTYYNPVLQYGIEDFARDAAAAGAAGAIVPDVTMEEVDALRLSLDARRLEMPLLVAPTTPRDRAAQIAEKSAGFIYVVSRLGVTGAGSPPDIDAMKRQVAMLRSVTQKPLAAGFGISQRAHVAAVKGLIDGVVIGSALLDAYAGESGERAAALAGAFLTSLQD